MNTITIPTPLVKLHGCYVDTVAHLLEHICSTNFSKNPENYFLFIIDSEASTYKQFIKFSYPDHIDIDTIILLLTKPITKEQYNFEWEVLYNELDWEYKEYEQILQERIGKNLYNKEYIKNSLAKPSFEIVSNYHKQYFIKSNIIISDKDDEIVYIGENIDAKRLTNNGIEYQWIQTYKNTTALCISYNGWASHRIAFFYYELLKNYNRYQARYIQGNYYYDDILYNHHKEHIIISYGNGFIDDIDEDFFENFKNYYIREFQKSYDSYRKVIDVVYGYLPITNNEYIDYIQNISFNSILDIKKRR